MPFLHARTEAGELVQFERDQLAVFWPVGSGSLDYFADNSRYIERIWAIVLAGGRWYRGRFEVYDGVKRTPPKPSPQPTPGTMIKPIPPARGVEPEMAIRVPGPRFDYKPIEQFREISHADAADWFYRNVGRVPGVAQAAFDAGRAAEATEAPGPDLALDPVAIVHAIRDRKLKRPARLVELVTGAEGGRLTLAKFYAEGGRRITRESVERLVGRTNGILARLPSRVRIQLDGEHLTWYAASE